jgi:uncharacterized coiled-coil protein SlyX
LPTLMDLEERIKKLEEKLSVQERTMKELLEFVKNTIEREKEKREREVREAEARKAELGIGKP